VFLTRSGILEFSQGKKPYNIFLTKLQKTTTIEARVPKTTRLPFFLRKDHYFYGNNFAKSTDRALDAG
jgi:hypothetical protein